MYANYIIGIEKFVEIIAYADDTTIFFSVFSADLLITATANFLEYFQDSPDTKCLSINASKIKEIFYL